MDPIKKMKAQKATMRQKPFMRLREKQTMDVFALMTGGICHDFNTLLTAILGYGELLLISPSLADPERRKVEDIVAAAVQARSITQQMLAFGRGQYYKDRIVNLSALIQELETLLKRLAGSKTEMMMDLRWDVGGVRADVTQVTQIIMNLVANARDAMPSGGTLTLRTSSVELSATNLEFSGAHPGQYVVLDVVDTGCGMDDATRVRIFEPFFTTKTEGKGTGLGLAMIQEIVARMGGYIRVVSRLSQGTHFQLAFPKIQAPTDNVQATGSECAKLAGIETVLVVDDHDVARNLTIEFLASFGYVVLAAKNGKEAVRLAKKYARPIHLLLTDVVMPKMSGPILAKEFVSIHPETKVVYMTAYADSLDVQHAGVEKAEDVLSKPYMHHELLGKVRRTLGATIAQ